MLWGVQQLSVHLGLRRDGHLTGHGDIFIPAGPRAVRLWPVAFFFFFFCWTGIGDGANTAGLWSGMLKEVLCRTTTHSSVQYSVGLLMSTKVQNQECLRLRRPLLILYDLSAPSVALGGGTLTSTFTQLLYLSTIWQCLYLNCHFLLLYTSTPVHFGCKCTSVFIHLLRRVTLQNKKTTWFQNVKTRQQQSNFPEKKCFCNVWWRHDLIWNLKAAALSFITWSSVPKCVALPEKDPWCITRSPLLVVPVVLPLSERRGVKNSFNGGGGRRSIASFTQQASAGHNMFHRLEG